MTNDTNEQQSIITLDELHTLDTLLDGWRRGLLSPDKMHSGAVHENYYFRCRSIISAAIARAERGRGIVVSLRPGVNSDDFAEYVEACVTECEEIRAMKSPARARSRVPFTSTGHNAR